MHTCILQTDNNPKPSELICIHVTILEEYKNNLWCEFTNSIQSTKVLNTKLQPSSWTDFIKTVDVQSFGWGRNEQKSSAIYMFENEKK